MMKHFYELSNPTSLGVAVKGICICDLNPYSGDFKVIKRKILPEGSDLSSGVL